MAAAVAVAVAAISAVAVAAPTLAAAVAACVWAAAAVSPVRAWAAEAISAQRVSAAVTLVRPGSAPAYSGARVAGGGNWNHGGGGYYRHGRFFPGVAAGIAAGAVLGSYAYYNDPYYYGDNGYYADNGYYDDGTTVVVPGSGGDASYCAQRYRSWDPGSQTYLGNDGYAASLPVTVWISRDEFRTASSGAPFF